LELNHSSFSLLHTPASNCIFFGPVEKSASCCLLLPPLEIGFPWLLLSPLCTIYLDYFQKQFPVNDVDEGCLGNVADVLASIDYHHFFNDLQQTFSVKGNEQFLLASIT